MKGSDCALILLVLVLFGGGSRGREGENLLWTEYSSLSGQGCLKNLQVRSSGKFLSRGSFYNWSKEGQISMSRLKWEEVTGNIFWKQAMEVQCLPACSCTNLFVKCTLLMLAREYMDAAISVARFCEMSSPWCDSRLHSLLPAYLSLCPQDT